mgnify:CR=1 FL=1
MPREGHDRPYVHIISLINDFNPRAPRGARRRPRRRVLHEVEISIHVPREGHDCTPLRQARRVRISIHVPREGHDYCSPLISSAMYAFQSTCPARGTTAVIKIKRRNKHDFNPRAPRGARLSPASLCNQCFTYFNPRAPRGARRDSCFINVAGFAFQSTCPARGTTAARRLWLWRGAISIHVPREGHDALTFIHHQLL